MYKKYQVLSKVSDHKTIKGVDTKEQALDIARDLKQLKRQVWVFELPTWLQDSDTIAWNVFFEKGLEVFLD